MTFQITIKPGNFRFPTEKNETLLDAAIKNGVTMPYSCKEGTCGMCKGKIIEGQVDQGNYLSSGLSRMELDAGMTLFCCARPKSDLVIECHTASMANNDVPLKFGNCRVHKMTRLSEDVMMLQLELPPNEPLNFLAGQYISILPKDQKPRNFSLANAPHNGEFLELHIRKIENGVFTQHVFNGMKERDILRFKGPLGKFKLSKNSKPAILIAEGAGFAPIKAIIEHALHTGLQRPMQLYWGGKRPGDLYMLEQAKRWEQNGIEFIPVLSEALPEDKWQGRTGLVHEAVIEDYYNLSFFEVYACGAIAMVDAAHRELAAQRNLSEESFFSEVFDSAPSPFQEN